jgi:hypothetical protein
VGAIFQVPVVDVEVDDLTPFEGQWVAVRDGHVVAHNADPARLFEDPSVEEGDEFIPVGPRGVRLFLF